ncbi:ATPase subunit of ABC transporter with duplicated ATPase domains [Geodermatophilus tzadiensis]|uniref:ATPase subunit of ABC transporter with duplicated ATPase domains n=1 Tax=Geodermatophilus tzadiensis TaxID=1137988 RepID=A0A2T0U1A8_9ACTN|nr:ABC-F family ATP-binding cassette domain-containing protein [Geodermatophilus tzadiensis]PRY51720.1 ATPase subunit of ABC transporter with duplicated ATPase domains [Geodermatophilus tzadiensis]
MSATLVARGLAAGHGARVLFADLDLVVAPGDVVGLVGVNGAGKSTLLRTLAGELPAESGSITLSPPTATVGHLPQEHERRAGETVAAALARRTGVTAAQAALDTATADLAAGLPGADDAYGEALERWLALGGADLDERLEQVLAEVAPGVAPDAAVTGLSGGQAARVGLAALLLSRHDLLLLDEPTNDLDLAGLEQLEAFVAGNRSGIVLVSHDREFLARTVTRVVELDLAQQLVRVHDGGYESYLVEREVARRHAREEYEEYAGTKADLEARARMQRNWLAKGVRDAVKKQKDPDKFIKAHNRATAEKQGAKAKQTERRIERLEVVEEPRKEWELRMTIAAAPRAGAVVATLRDAVVRRGGFTLGPVSLQVDWGDRVAITGPNGSGKTTLLGALLGRVPLDEGTASLGPSVRLGEVDQARGLFVGERRLIEAFAAEVPDWPTAEVRTLLAKFGLTAEHVTRPAASLSPGERTRAALALLQARGVNVLVLDEPTNHLDLPAIEQLESALAAYPGTLLLVTHDRRMLEAVATTRRLAVDGGRVVDVS